MRTFFFHGNYAGSLGWLLPVWFILGFLYLWLTNQSWRSRKHHGENVWGAGKQVDQQIISKVEYSSPGFFSFFAFCLSFATDWAKESKGYLGLPKINSPCLCKDILKAIYMYSKDNHLHTHSELEGKCKQEKTEGREEVPISQVTFTISYTLNYVQCTRFYMIIKYFFPWGY